MTNTAHHHSADVRLALCGASGTGKTTIANAVAERLGLEVCPVGSRSVAASMGFDSPYDVDRAGRRAEFQRRLLAEKSAWEASRASFVTDRTPLDNLAYTILEGAVRQIDDAFVDACYAGMTRYTHVLVCPMTRFWRVGSDPARETLRHYHELFERVLEGLVLGRIASDEQRVGEVAAHGAEEAVRETLAFVRSRGSRVPHGEEGRKGEGR